MAIRAVVYKRCFKTGFYPCDFGFIYIGFFLFSGFMLYVKVVEFLPIHYGNPQFFRLRSVYKHSFHCCYRPVYGTTRSTETADQFFSRVLYVIENVLFEDYVSAVSSVESVFVSNLFGLSGRPAAGVTEGSPVRCT